MTSYVLVHGAFCDGWYWGEVPGLLVKEGHRVHVADLPSTGTSPAGLGGLADDAADVRRPANPWCWSGTPTAAW